MYTGISTRRDRWTLLFYPIFISRRLFFVLIPLLFKGKEYFQLQMLIFGSSLYLIYYGSFHPHIMKRQAFMEVTNEALFLVLTYHFLTFTLFNMDISSKYTMGFSYLASLSVLVIANVTDLVLKSVAKFKRKKELARLKKSREMHAEGFKLLTRFTHDQKFLQKRNSKKQGILIADIHKKISKIEEEISEIEKPYVSKRKVTLKRNLEIVREVLEEHSEEEEKQT
mmetsp:Transcript_27557/g.41854  ORF Transcript_27557/g.41854 Transcript_27557/m.41854 type:complete len:225 (-) Transcript_27557:442-1116(-)